MATNSCIPLNFHSVCGKAFIFEEIDTDVDPDAFEMSALPAERSWIRSKDNKFVVINFEQNNFQAQTMNSAQLRKPECQFQVKMYKDSKLDTCSRPVIVYHQPANSEGKPMVACCNEDNSICAEEMDLPHEILEPAHKAVFLRQEIASSRYELQSSLYKNRYLGFMESDDGLYTLVLLQKGGDEVDDARQIYISKCKQ